MPLNKKGTKICNKTCKNDMLRVMWDYQKSLDDSIHEMRGITKQDTKSDRFTALVCEIGEVLKEDEFYKYWKVQAKRADKDDSQREKVREELVDVIHFLLSLCQDYFEGPQELFEYYCSKNEINLQRQNNKY